MMIIIIIIIIIILLLCHVISITYNRQSSSH